MYIVENAVENQWCDADKLTRMSVLPNNWQFLFIYKIPESSCYYTAPIIDSYSKMKDYMKDLVSSY